MNTILLFLCLLVLSTNAVAISTLDRDVKELYKASDLVVVGDVKEINGKCRGKDRCWGYMIRVARTVVLKGTKGIERMETNVCSDAPLEPGRTYTLFLENARNNPVGKIGRCKYALPLDGAFQERAGEVYRVGSPQGFVNVTLEGNVYWTNAILVPGFKEDITSISASSSDAAERSR